jgi:hypothetical protein
MLQAHSLLWNYLWVGPNVLLLGLAVLAWQRNLHRRFPAFMAFAVLGSLEQLANYAADVAPRVTPLVFWRVFWAGLLVEAAIKFFLLGEIFLHVSGKYPSLAKVGRLLIRGVGVILILTAAVAAAFAHSENDSMFGIVRGAHILEQTTYLVECGVLLFVFLFAKYYRLGWDRMNFGIALGLSISACVHMADWAVTSNGILGERRYLLDFVNMATYHVCVLIWWYFLLTDGREFPKQNDRMRPLAPRLPEIRLEELNHELEQLLHR